MKYGFVIPVYRHGSTLEAVVKSLLAYDFPIIVVDDGNDEENRAYISEVAEKYSLVTLVTRKKNGGKGKALSDEYKEYMGRVVENAATLAAALQERGFKIVSGGTDNHLMLVDLQNLGLTGKEVEKLLDEVHITVNKNTVPNDPKSPFVTSGIRVGTPAVTTRGAVKEDMYIIADAFKAAIIDKDMAKAEALVKDITDRYPLYGGEMF